MSILNEKVTFQELFSPKSHLVVYGKLGSGSDQKTKEFISEGEAKKFKEDMEKAGYTASYSKKA